MEDERILTTGEVSELLNVKAGTLRYWRHAGRGPRWFRMGGAFAYYKQSDVTAWLDEQYAKGGV